MGVSHGFHYCVDCSLRCLHWSCQWGEGQYCFCGYCYRKPCEPSKNCKGKCQRKSPLGYGWMHTGDCNKETGCKCWEKLIIVQPMCMDVGGKCRRAGGECRERRAGDVKADFLGTCKPRGCYCMKECINCM